MKTNNCNIPYDDLVNSVKDVCIKYREKRSLYCSKFFENNCYIEEDKIKYIKEFKNKNRECSDEYKLLLKNYCGKNAYNRDINLITSKAKCFDFIIDIFILYFIVNLLLNFFKRIKIFKNK